MQNRTAVRVHNPRLGIAFICFGMFFITVNDTIIKQFSDYYPLHQMVFIRSLIGIVLSLTILQFEGGFKALRTDQPWLHLLRGVFLIFANMLFFLALATVPLGDATAVFFVAPLMITLLSIPILGEKVGIRRLSAVLAGFFGVLVMMQPGMGDDAASYDKLTLLLAVGAAFAYSCMQVLTRKLGITATASAMAAYTQGLFILVSLGFFFVAGDGRFADGLESKSLSFLLRAWTWPREADWPLFLLLGLMSACIGYSLAQAYRIAEAGFIAPFEYVALPMAIAWGWLVFGDWPDIWVFAGTLLICLAGIYVFWRERKLEARPTSA